MAQQGVNDLDFVTLTRAQFTVKYWLRIKTHEVDPVIHLERPIVHLAELFSSSSNPPLSGNLKKSHWSPSNLSFIRTLNLSHVRQLATSLLAFAVEVKLATGRNPEGVAAAAVVMAMEGIARELVPSPSDFFDELGHLFTMKAYTIGERHKEFGHLLTDWAGSLPWLKDEVGKVKGKKLKKLVAENMADIVELRKGLERKRGEAEIKEEAVGREVRKAKKEESEEEEEGEEDEEDVDWDDDEGEDDPPGGPSNFFIDPLFNPQAAADTLRAGDDPNTTTTTTTDLNPELKPNSPVPGPPYLSTWSQLAATFHARRIEGGGGGKRPAQYMRHRPGPVKRVRTIESVAQSLLSPFADGPTSTPSPAPPEVEASASPSSATLRPTASASTSPPRARSASLPIIDTASVAPKRRFVDPSRANPFASHSNEAVAFRQLLLAGHDVTSIFEGTAQYEPSSALKSSRLDRLLWVKRVEEVEDDELFDEGELEAIIRTGEEVEMLKRTEKWLTMPEAKVPLSATEGGRKNPRQRKKPRTRVPRRKGPSLEEEEEIERIKAGKTTTMGRPVGSGGGGGGVQRSRRTKVSQDMKERLLKVLEAPDEEEGNEEEEEAFNLGMAIDVAAASEEDDDDEDEGSDSDFL